MAEATKPEVALLSYFSQRKKELAQAGPEWLKRARRQALARFQELGFPTSRLEAWKNTNVAPIARTPFVPAPDARARVTADRLAALGLDGVTSNRLVFVNGRYVADLSTRDGLPAEVWSGSLAEGLETQSELVERHLFRYADYRDQAFTALNTAFIEDGGMLVVPDGVELDQAVQLLYLSVAGDEPTACHPRTLLVVGRNSRVSLIETFVGLNGSTYLTNAVTEVFIDENACVDHYRIQNEGRTAFHIGALHSHQARNSRFTAHNFDLGCSLGRLDTGAVLDGEGSECILNGLYLTSGKQHVDNHTTLDHAKPHCQSRELYKGILADNSRAVFNGRIIVRQDAQKTDAKQSNPNLLISNGALVHTRPQLEIYADDVKCTHGATIGRLDENARFYLQSRGIDAEDARNLLIRAFASEVLERIGIKPLKARLDQEIAGRLARIEAR